MVALKKQILNYRLKKVITKYVFVLFYQLNHGNTKQWRKLKQDLTEIGNIESFLIKNKIACKALKKNKQNFVMTPVKLSTMENKFCSKLAKSSKSEDLQILKDSTNYEKKQIIHFIDTLFQGPTFVIACQANHELKGINHILKEYSNLFFIAGIFKDKVFTHLDFHSLLKLDESIYGKFCLQCISPIHSILLLNKSFNFEYLKQKQYEFLLVLQEISKSK